MSEHMMRVDVGGGREQLRPVDYPSNSNKSRATPPEREKVDKVVTGEVTQRKKPWTNRLGGSFVAEGSESVGQYILLEVLIPAAKNMISDAVSQGVERLLFGDSRPRGSSGTRPGYTNYNKARTGPDPRDLSRRARANHEFEDIILASRGEAEEVLDRLRDLVDKYDQASVADLYDLVGISSQFTDDKWGWNDLRSAGVRAIRGGYLLNLPRTQPID